MFKKKPVVKPDLSDLLSEFNRSLMLIVDKPLLINNFVAKVKEVIAVESIYVFLLDENTGRYKLQNHPSGRNYILTEKDRLINWLSVNDKELVISGNAEIVEYFLPDERQLIRELAAELVYPLKVMNHITGTVFLGRKTDGTNFSEQEIVLLSLMFDQAAFAIEHSSLYEVQSERIKRMYRTDRLAILGELAAGAAHEIRNPLTAIRSTVQYLSKDFKDDPVKSEMAGEIITEVERINKIVQGLLSFARPSELNMTEVYLDQCVSQVLLLLNATLQAQNVDVQLEFFTGQTCIRADAEQLKQLFLNVILNAVEAMNGNGPGRERSLIVSIEQGTSIDAYRRYLIVSVEDTGDGISDEDADKVFNPFYTTKEEGTGLGLAICYGIVSRHEGEISFSSLPGKGTTVTVKLPQAI